ncbi:beta/gamma crystallin domain-containing protein [Xenorhabdus anantnagensis]|uniref:Beta/gamma crystallin domain-containing protein n=1 Tax=Xenorhabdus anantnagensis TaxID=3025875 RepID=A0ABT5LQ93_9GAMM|nr:beta/gamma crystallin domain-containing protein [Xenorhabdus anantnagensis]MDC9596582.1 beta/gamma crystallin domain-containing protein [Xenorhabdus anantnagensis]
MSKNKLAKGAIFYTKNDYSGDSYEYPENSLEVNLIGTPLNDKFLSVEIGKGSIVFAWRHGDDSQPGQIYREWDTSQPDLSDIKGLSKFIVSPTNCDLLAVKLINESGVDQVFRVHIQTHTIPDPVDCYSNGDYEIVGLIPKDGQQYVTSVVVFDKNNIPVTQGAVYFTYNGTELDIITYDVTKPPYMRFEKAGSYHFNFVLEKFPTNH